MSDEPAPTALSVPLPVIGRTSVRDVSIEQVGNKAYNLMSMSESGLPVPPAFVLTTDLCRSYHDHGRRLPPEVDELLGGGVAILEQATNRRFGGSRRPLLLSIRSGAPVSMPGMLDTILNIGLDDVTLPGLLRVTGDPTFVWDSYRRFIQAYAEIVDGCRSAPFSAVIDEALTREGVPAVDELDVAAVANRRGSPPRPVPLAQRPSVPAGPDGPTPARRRIGAAIVVRTPRRRLSPLGRASTTGRNGGGHPIHGVRQHGTQLRIGRRLHQRPGLGRKPPLRRLPAQRPRRRHRGRAPRHGRLRKAHRGASPGSPTSSNRSASGSKPSSTTPKTSSSPSKTARCGCCRPALPSAHPSQRYE